MGKIGKKTKSDRINALRKQYDAFLDEDKKRKERNEFILGSLEKMRLYTPAVVPVRHNMERPEYLRKIRFDDNSIIRSRQIDMSPVYVTKDEERILKEIGKKYILIPKLQLTSENNVTTHYPLSAKNDTDWRKKYSILDELKKIEKEGSSEISVDQLDKVHDNLNNEHELITTVTKNISESNKQNLKRDLVPSKPHEKMQVSQLNTNKTKKYPTSDANTDSKPLLKCTQKIIPNIVENTTFENEALLKADSTSEKIDQPHTSDPNEINIEFYSHGNEIKAEVTNINNNKEKITYNKVHNIQGNEMKVTDKVLPISIEAENIKNEPGDQNNAQELRSSNIADSAFVTELVETGNIKQNIKKDEMAQRPVETDKNQEPSPIKIKNDAEDIQQEYELNNTANISDNGISSQNDDYEAEQKQMFYSDETSYDRNVESIVNNTQNEEHTDDQYSYYNESQQDQPLYSEINEHEESTERYDPNYQQQYAENYEENENVAHYENQQYEENSYNNQLENTNGNYEQQPEQQEVLNVNYDQQPEHLQVTTANYEEQPVNYEYEQTEHIDNPDPSHVEDTGIYDGEVSEHVNYETQLYDETGDIEHHTNPNQNVYESQQNYVQNTELEPIQNSEEHLIEEGYTDIKNEIPDEPGDEVKNTNQILK